MSTHAPSDDAESATAAANPRPRELWFAFWATVARAVFTLATALLISPLRDDLLDIARKHHPEWTADRVDSSVITPTAALLSAVLVVFFVLLLARFALQGKNWARWIIAITAVYPLYDVTKVTALFVSDVPPLLRIALFLPGLSTVASILFFFLPPTSRYFRASGTAGGRGFLGSLLRPRVPGPDKQATTAHEPNGSTVSTTPKPEASSAARKPRAKSRKSPTE